MANEDEVCEAKFFDFTFEELENTFSKLFDDFKKIKLKNNKLKAKVLALTNEKEEFSKSNGKLTQEFECLRKQQLELTKEKDKVLQENQSLKEELEKVKPFIDKFTYSSEKLDLLLNNQRTVFDKAGLGFKTQRKQKFFKNFFVPASTSFSCYCCGMIGHKAYQCVHRKINNFNKVWVPKGTTTTNPKGSKMTWVPKVKT